MAFEFKLPELGEGLAEGEIASWLVKVGDQVQEDDSLVEIQNDKSVEELPSPVSGKILAIHKQAGETAQIGDVLVEIDDGSGGNAQSAAGQPSSTAESNASQSATPASATSTAAPAVNGSARVLAMPSVRQYARDQQVNLALVAPTGNHGQLVKADIDQYLQNNQTNQSVATGATSEPVASASPATAAKAVVSSEAGTTSELPETREAMTPVRKAIAKAMVTSKHTAPHVTLFDEVEVTDLMTHRKKYKQLASDREIKLTFLPYIVKSLVTVLREFPIFNASLDEATQEIVYKHYYNIGIATDTDHGLYVPNIKHAEAKGLFAVAKDISENTQSALAGKLSAQAMRNGSITISNIGSIGGGWFTPVINYPEVAILGVGRIAKAPYVDEDGKLAVGNLMKLSLSFDHRLIDGATAQRAMNLLKQLLHDPEMLLMEG